jgi:hypothetical protein
MRVFLHAQKSRKSCRPQQRTHGRNTPDTEVTFITPAKTSASVGEKGLPDPIRSWFNLPGHPPRTGGKADTQTPKKPGTPNPKKVQEILKAFDGQRWVSTYRGERLVGQPPFREGFEFLSRQVFADNLTTLAEYLSAGKAK